MKKRWLVALGILALMLAIGGQAGALDFGDDDCANPDSVIDTPAEAVRVANGYNCPGVDLVIKTSLNDNPPSDIVDGTLPITAKSITVGPHVNPVLQVEIINEEPNSVMRLIAKNGDIIISQASIKARNFLEIRCDAPATCKVDVDDSEIIGSATLQAVFPPPSGVLRIVAQGDVELTNSIIFGGSLLAIISNNGKVTFICPGAGGCRDPLTSSKAVELCGVPPGTPPAVFPCTVTFDTAQDLKKVCLPGVTCGGGGKEIDIRAKLDIILTGSTIIGADHVVVRSSDGSLLADNANLTADSWRITVKVLVTIKDAVITAVGVIRIEATDCTGTLAPGAPFCVDAEGATLDAANGGTPTLNGVVVGVPDPACTPLNGKTTIVAAGGAGEINIQDACFK